MNNDPQEALNLVKDAFVYGFRNFWKFNGNSWGTKEQDRDYILLKPLHENTLIQEYIKSVYKPIIEYWGFDIKKTPLCWFEKSILNRKNEKCLISRKKLEKGIEVYQFRFFNGAYDIPTDFFFADIGSFHSCKEAMENLRKYKDNNYQLSDFAFKVSYKHPLINAFWNRLDDFNLQETLHLIANPPVNPSAFRTYYFDGKLQEISKGVGINSGTGGEFLNLLYVLVKCGFLNDICSMLPELPEHFQVTLMCFEMESIREKVSSYIGLPELSNLYSMAFNFSKKNEEVKQIIEFGKNNPDFRKKLAVSLNIYEYHLYSNYQPGINWFFQEFKKFNRAKGGGLLDFLVAEPELIPVLKKMKENICIPFDKNLDAYKNSRPFLYRTITLNAAFYDVKKLELWLDVPKDLIWSSNFKSVHGKTKKIIERCIKTSGC